MKSEAKVQIIYKTLNVSNKKLVLNYDIDIFNLSKEKLSNDELKEILIKFIPSKDRRYITILSFNNNSVRYAFDGEKWIKSALGEKVLDTMDYSEKRIRIKKLPSMIVQSVSSVDYCRYIDVIFRNYINNNEQLKKKIIKSIKFTNVKTLTLGHFNFHYDYHFNCVNISLKTEFRMSPLLLTQDEIKTKKVNFDKNLKDYLKIYNTTNKSTK